MTTADDKHETVCEMASFFSTSCICARIILSLTVEGERKCWIKPFLCGNPAFCVLYHFVVGDDIFLEFEIIFLTVDGGTISVSVRKPNTSWSLSVTSVRLYSGI